MNYTDLVLIDTVVWSAFFSKPSSTQKRIVDALLDEDRVAVTGPVLAEVLRGFRRKQEADWVESRMRASHYFEPSWDDWSSAAALGRELASNGHDLPLTDLVIAAMSQARNLCVFTSDPHFDFIPSIKRYRLAQ